MWSRSSGRAKSNKKPRPLAYHISLPSRLLIALSFPARYQGIHGKRLASDATRKIHPPDDREEMKSQTTLPESDESSVMPWNMLSVNVPAIHWLRPSTTRFSSSLEPPSDTTRFVLHDDYNAGRFPLASLSCPCPLASILSRSSSSLSRSASVFPDVLCPVTGVVVPLLFADTSCELSP